MRKLLFILPLVLTACTHYVNIPVWYCPEPKIPVREELKSKGITDKSTTDEILMSFIYDVSYLNNYSNQLTLILQGYKKEK